MCNHIMNKQDSAHSGIDSYGEAKDFLHKKSDTSRRAESGEEPVDDPSGEGPPEGGGDPSESPDSGQSGDVDPSMSPSDPPLPVGGAGGAEPECPECGSGRYFDVVEFDVPGGYACADCSTEETWVVYDV
jgi:hypothetical protein